MSELLPPLTPDDLASFAFVSDAQLSPDGKQAAYVVRHMDVGLRGLLIWVLRENTKGRSFYGRMGGRAERERPFEIAGASITETGYVWDDTALLRSRSAGGSSGSTQRM